MTFENTPAWAWDLLIAALDYEDVHHADHPCMSSVLSAIPVEVRYTARAIDQYQRDAQQRAEADVRKAIAAQLDQAAEDDKRQIGPDWRRNDPFTATLRLAETRRGRSAAYFIWRSDDGRKFPMFISDMLLLVQSGVTIRPGGMVSTRWMVTKRGSNYGIRHANPEESGNA